LKFVPAIKLSARGSLPDGGKIIEDARTIDNPQIQDAFLGTG
jgi:hypothetical protein